MGLFSTLEAVEILKRDKQIASLTAEIKRLRNGLQDIYLGVAIPKAHALKILTHKGPNP